MCKYYSALVLRNGDIMHNPWTQSHQDLIEEFEIKDNDQFRKNFVKIEFYPDDDNDVDDEMKYNLHVDEDETPDWFKEIQESVAEQMRDVIRRMIIKNQALKIITGKCIILSNSRVGKLVNASCYVMKKSNVGKMLGSSKVGTMLDSSTVGIMLDSSNVGTMLDSSNVGKMLGSSNVGKMLGSSNVGTMWDSSKVGTMLDSSNVGTMWDSSNVGTMLGSSKVGTMLDSSKIINDKRDL